MTDLESLKKTADVPGIIGRRIELRPAGADVYKACCPFHAERTPSWTLDKKQGTWLWKCFGCGEGGDVITFIEKFDHVDSKTAINSFMELAGANAEYHSQAARVNETFKPIVDSSKKPKTVLTLTQWASFENALSNSVEGLRWLKEVRGINESTIKSLHLGFRQAHKCAIKEDLEACREQGWIMFPRIVGESVVAVKFRSITEKAFSQIPNMDSRSLFNIETVNPLEPVFVTEGEPDACILEMAGYRAVSIPSAGVDLHPKDKQILKLAESIYLAGDNDQGVGTQYMKKLLHELGRNTYWLVWPGTVKDANDFFRDTCKRDPKLFYTEVQRAMSEARNRPPENIEDLLTLMRKSQASNPGADPDRLHFPKELADVGDIMYTPKGSVAIIYSTYSGTGKSMLKTQILLHEAARGEVVVDLSPEIRGPEYVALVTSQTLGRMTEDSQVKRTNKIDEAQIQEAARLLDVTTEKGTDFRYYVGFNIPGQTEEDVLGFIRSTIQLLSATRFAIDTFHRLIHATGKGSQVDAEGRMAKKLEEMGVELGCIFILIGQSNAEAEGVDNLKRNTEGVLRGSREFRDVATSIYLIHRNQQPKVDGASSGRLLELDTRVVAKKIRYDGPGPAEAKLLLNETWSLFVPRISAAQEANEPRKSRRDIDDPEFD